MNIKENYYEQLDKVKIIKKLSWEETIMEKWDPRWALN
jgi:hypothetical protein